MKKFALKRLHEKKNVFFSLKHIFNLIFNCLIEFRTFEEKKDLNFQTKPVFADLMVMPFFQSLKKRIFTEIFSEKEFSTIPSRSKSNFQAPLPSLSICNYNLTVLFGRKPEQTDCRAPKKREQLFKSFFCLGSDFFFQWVFILISRWITQKNLVDGTPLVFGSLSRLQGQRYSDKAAFRKRFFAILPDVGNFSACPRMDTLAIFKPTDMILPSN